MNNIAGIIVSFLLMAYIIFGIAKKWNVNFILLSAGFLGIVYYTLFNQASVLGEKGIGSRFLDIFEYMATVWSSQMTSQIMLLMAIMGYICYMNSLKATTLLCRLLAKPLAKMKSPWVVVGFMMYICVIMKWAVFSNSAQAALLLTTIVPILISIGISMETAASVLAFSCCVISGPANGITVMIMNMAPSDYAVPELFMRYELINTAIATFAALIAFYFTSKYFDKKENVVFQCSEYAAEDEKSLGLPAWYAALPFLPIILVLIFSKLIAGNIVMTVTGASLLSFAFVIICELIRNKDKKKVLENTQSFWKGTADMMLLSGGLIICANIFSGILNKIGGIAALFEMIFSGNSVSAGLTILIIIGSVVASAYTAVGGSVIGAASLFGPIYAAIAQNAGISMHVILKTFVPAGFIGAACSPISAGNMFVSAQTKVPLLTIVKRNLVPAAVYIVVSIIVTQFILIW